MRISRTLSVVLGTLFMAGALAVPAQAAPSDESVQILASFTASNSFGRASGDRGVYSQRVTASGTITDYAANPSTSYAYLSWQEYHHGAWTNQNEQIGWAANGTTKPISGSFLTPYDVRNVRVTVCTSAGSWYCGVPA